MTPTLILRFPGATLWVRGRMAGGPLGDGSARGLRDLGQIPYLAPPPPSQSQVDAADEEETTSMRELVQAIDAHVDLKVSKRDFMGSKRDGWWPSR